MRSCFLKTAYICIFSLLNSGFVFSQIIDFTRENPYKKVFVETDNFGPSYLEQLEEAYSKATPDSLQFSILNDLAYYWHTRNLVKAMDFTQKGITLTKEKSNALWEGRFQITLGAILLRMEKLDEAQVVLESAKNKVLEKDLALLNTQLGYVYERRGQLDKAADYALEALNLGKKLNDTKVIAMAYSDLSNLFWKQAKYEAGVEYGLKSLKGFEEWGITDLDYGFTLYVVGNNYLAVKDYDRALQLFEHSLIIGERYGFYNNLSDIYISLVDLYAYLGEFDKASDAGTNAIKYAELLNNEFMLMRSWLSVGKLRYAEGDYLMAIESLKKSIDIATVDFGDEFYLSQAYEALGKAYAANQDYQKAYQAFAEYDTLKARIFTAEADHRTSLLLTEFDLAGKEGTILEQETLLKKQQTRQTLISIITGLLLLLLFLSYKAIRNKFKINNLLRKQNEEKEFILKEIHHRVKNNLEIVSSLLALQSAQIKDTNVLVAMEESRHRVQSMSMIHQKLYMGKNLATIEMRDYLIDLADYICDAFGMQKRVVVDIEMEKLELDVDTAIPIGLIVNELLTNSFKHAFEGRQDGKIRIALKQVDDHLQLDVNDNGSGQTIENRDRGKGFGTKLIKLLTKQLDGKMVLNTNQGTSVTIQFQYHKAA
jgi:two-component sensor histidine kinase/Tfp pilus assembly protein PilF